MDDRLISQYCNQCKEFSQFFCYGCKKNFCQIHANEHQQSFYEQLDWLTVDHDDLINKLDHTLTFKQINSQSKKIIDKWEEESIKSIQKTANEARQALIDSIQIHINDVKDKLKKLTEKFNIISQNNNISFDERNLKQWANELQNIRDDFLTTPSFTVRIHGNKPVVMPIIKIQPESKYENLPNEQQQQSPPPPPQQQNLFGLIPLKRSNPLSESSHINIKQEKINNNNDQFSLHSEHIKILEQGQIIVHDSTNNDASIRGLHEYSYGKYQLFFRIEHMTKNQWIFFGIISKHGIFDQQAYRNLSSYGWTGYNSIYINGKSIPTLNGYVNDMKENDLIELIIDCDTKTICFWHSRQTYKIRLSIDIEKCPFPWQFLISCHNPNDSIRILPLSMSSLIKREQFKLNKDMKIKENDIEINTIGIIR